MDLRYNLIKMAYKRKEGKNILNPATVPDTNYFVNRLNGGLTKPSATGGEWRHSDYIPVIANTAYYFGEIPALASTAGTAWYDSEYNFISGFNATTLSNNNNIMTAPENAAYMRHSWRIDEGYNTNWENTVYICIKGDLHKFKPYEEE